MSSDIKLRYCSVGFSKLQHRVNIWQYSQMTQRLMIAPQLDEMLRMLHVL